MGKSEGKTYTSCPHFYKEMNTCSLYADGFYIPPKEKLLTYCLTPIYNKCPIYKKKRFQLKLLTLLELLES